MDGDHSQYRDQIHFFVDATNGQAYSHNDIETYLKRIGASLDASYFTPKTHPQIVRHLISEVAKCFCKEQNEYKQQELMQLVALIDELI